MSIIKKLDTYILKSFLSYFAMTFFIVMFILLMQFTWKHLEDLVGKGVSWGVIGEFFMYAATSLIPMALPLAILLASLMAYGNLGENFELTAMKSAGISLFRIMRGLIVFISFVSIGAFFFSNYVLPITQTKLYALVLSLKQKSPEFAIPTGEFYTGIRGYNLYVNEKDPNKKLLKDLMIYNFSNGFYNASVTLADSGKVQFTADKKYLKFTLYNGESFENMQQQNFADNTQNVPYRRETFKLKELLIDYNSGFDRLDESILKNEQVSKNLKELNHSIDSISKIVNTQGDSQAKEIINTNLLYQNNGNPGINNKIASNKEIATKEQHVNIDSLLQSMSRTKMTEAVMQAKENAKAMSEKVEYNRMMITEPLVRLRRHEIEKNRKFTLSFACLIFFFIGAPLGAIIRKGGLGVPVLISVILFIIYYIIDTTGYKMAREGVWEVYQGMWLSSFILLPFGLFLTYKAVTDAALFRSESYEKAMERIVKYFKKNKK